MVTSRRGCEPGACRRTLRASTVLLAAAMVVAGTVASCASPQHATGATPGNAIDAAQQTTADTDPSPVSVPPALPYSNPPPPQQNVVGPAADASSSPLLGAVIDAWTSMKQTKYQHHDRENASAGTYYFDCVGMTNYFTQLADPHAQSELRSAEHIGADYVPSPAAYAHFFSSLSSSSSTTWQLVTQVSQIQPGDIVIGAPQPGTNQPGHAMVAAGPPLLLSNGAYALLVYDSTAQPAHGTEDSRNWDPRDLPLQPGNRHSGLGRGTIELTVTSSGGPDKLLWSVGGSATPYTVWLARPLS